MAHTLVFVKERRSAVVLPPFPPENKLNLIHFLEIKSYSCQYWGITHVHLFFQDNKIIHHEKKNCMRIQKSGPLQTLWGVFLAFLASKPYELFLMPIDNE